MIPSLIAVAIQQLPGVFAAIRAAHAADNPNMPTPTDAEVIAALNAAVESSIAVDDRWLAAHPAD